jgi:predicted short-subunit dehydrogenase-like oxidoreductase (DUF2520 family)
MIRVVLIGGGNLASHLCKAFLLNANISLVQMYNRTLSHIEHMEGVVPLTDSLEKLLKADIYLIATSDIAIERISKSTTHLEGLIVHTSGASELELLKNKRSGVFYPLQSFSKEVSVDFKKVPICIETNNTSDYSLLYKLATYLSEKVYAMSSDQRKKLHIAAVFVNNFVNHMYHIGEDICKEHAIPFEVLYPLIEETAGKITSVPPKIAQTGPAVRNDKKTVDLHQSFLKSNQKEIYKLLSNSISKKN